MIPRIGKVECGQGYSKDDNLKLHYNKKRITFRL